MEFDELRSLFPVTQRYIYLNHSGVSPMSTRVQKAMEEEIGDILNLATGALPKWYGRCEEFRRRFAGYIGAEAEEIAFTLNTSEGINIVADGLEWEPGDNVLLPDTEYPANVYPWMHLAGRGVEVRLVPDVEGAYPPEQFERYLDERTRLVAVSFVQFASGYRLDLARLGALCRRRDVLLLVDAIQGLGVLPLDVKAMQIDFLSTSTYKWMLGPQGAGLFYIDRRHLGKVQPRWVGSTSVVNPEDYLDYDLTFDPTAKRFQPGTLSTVSLAGAAAALELLIELGADFIHKRVFELTDCLCEGAKAKGYEVYSPWEPEQRSGILSIFKPAHDPEEARRLLLNNNVFASVRAGRLRLAPHCYNTIEEMEKVLSLLP